MPLSEASPRVFTAEEVTRRLADATGEATGDLPVVDSPKRWSLTTDVVTNLVGFIRNPAERWYLGIPEVDLASRGVGRGEVLLVVGRSHTGKSQVLLNGIVSNLVNNPAAHVVIFSMDEPRELVVMKLYCLLRGKSSTEVEEAVKSGDKEVIADLERAAHEELSRIAIVDESIPLPVMGDVLDEARDWWGCNPSFTMIDYLELLPGGDSDSTGEALGQDATRPRRAGASGRARLR